MHGFTQTRRSWRYIAPLLATSHQVTTVDAPGHGESSHLALDLPTAARVLAEQRGPSTYIGYSMGARLCLHLALERPELVERLILLGGSPGIEDLTERAARRVADEALADRIERYGVPAFLDFWLAQPMFANVGDTDGSDRVDRERNTATGLASCLRLAGTGAQASLWPRLHELPMSVLLLTGAHDTKFTSIAETMAAKIGSKARVDTIADAGHAAHLEQPASFVRLLNSELRRES